jgi:DNA-binding MarR family transcriptional regulator
MSDSATDGTTGAEFVEFVMTLYGFMERLRGEHEEAAATVSLTPAQATVLTSLSEPMSMRGLAQVMHCDPSNITGIIDRLEDKRLVERSVDPADRRIKLVAPTRSGRRAAARFQDELVRLSSLAKLDPDVRKRLRTALNNIDHQDMG